MSNLSGKIFFAIIFIIIFLYTRFMINYFAYHIMLELVISAIALAIFIVGWNTQQFLMNSSILLISLTYLVISIFGIFHVLTFPGSNVLNAGPQVYRNLCLFAAFFECISLLIAFFVKVKIKPLSALFVYLATASLIILLPFSKELNLNSGQYILFESILIVNLVAVLFNSRNFFDNKMFKLFSTAVIFRIICEVSITFSRNYLDIYSDAAHIFKFLSFFTLYLLLIESSLRKPYETLFNEYDESQKKLIATSSLVTTTFHDIKNKIALIRGLSQIACSKTDDPVEKKHHKKIIQQIDQLTALLNNNLNSFQDTHLLSYPIPNLIEKLVKEIKPLCITKQITINHKTENNLKLKIQPELLYRALFNIVKNSIDALNTKGEIYIELSNLKNKARITIKDNGPGIPVEIQSHIFKPFVSGKNGAGLGLYMAYYTIKNIHKGNIWFESKTGKGTTFHIELPVQ